MYFSKFKCVALLALALQFQTIPAEAVNKKVIIAGGAAVAGATGWILGWVLNGDLVFTQIECESGHPRDTYSGLTTSNVVDSKNFTAPSAICRKDGADISCALLWENSINSTSQLRRVQFCERTTFAVDSRNHDEVLRTEPNDWNKKDWEFGAKVWSTAILGAIPVAAIVGAGTYAVASAFDQAIEKNPKNRNIKRAAAFCAASAVTSALVVGVTMGVENSYANEVNEHCLAAYPQFTYRCPLGNLANKVSDCDLPYDCTHIQAVNSSTDALQFCADHAFIDYTCPIDNMIFQYSKPTDPVYSRGIYYKVVRYSEVDNEEKDLIKSDPVKYDPICGQGFYCPPGTRTWIDHNSARGLPNNGDAVCCPGGANATSCYEEWSNPTILRNNHTITGVNPIPPISETGHAEKYATCKARASGFQQDAKFTVPLAFTPTAAGVVLLGALCMKKKADSAPNSETSSQIDETSLKELPSNDTEKGLGSEMNKKASSISSSETLGN